MLRLLNLQNNSIRKIENLLGLPNLIFLDLYNNRVEVYEFTPRLCCRTPNLTLLPYCVVRLHN